MEDTRDMTITRVQKVCGARVRVRVSVPEMYRQTARVEHDNGAPNEP